MDSNSARAVAIGSGPVAAEQGRVVFWAQAATHKEPDVNLFFPSASYFSPFVFLKQMS